MKKKLLIIGVIWSAHLWGALTYITTVATPDSILSNKHNYKPCYVADRLRYATCTGACWFHDNYLAVLNLYGEKINAYKFNEQTKKFDSVQQLSNEFLKMPEQINISSDGTLLAISNTKGPSVIHIFAIDPQNHIVNSRPRLTISATGLVHNLRFSPDCRYFAYASFDDERSLCIYKIIRNGNNIIFEHINTYANNFELVKAKAVNFTKEGNYIIRGYALSIGESRKRPLESLVVVNKFNDDGSVGNLVSCMRGNLSIEDIALVQNDTAIIVSDQAHDLLYQYPFSPITGEISEGEAIPAESQEFSFPHGLAVSQNGKYLVATNYGNDSFNLYELDEGL